jgi:hypothetical protein
MHPCRSPAQRLLLSRFGFDADRGPKRVLIIVAPLLSEMIECDFRRVADQRHFARVLGRFATILGSTSTAEAYKKYLMGQAPGRAALNAYTHLNELRPQLEVQFRPNGRC